MSNTNFPSDIGWLFSQLGQKTLMITPTWSHQQINVKHKFPVWHRLIGLGIETQTLITMSTRWHQQNDVKHKFPVWTAAYCQNRYQNIAHNAHMKFLIDHSSVDGTVAKRFSIWWIWHECRWSFKPALLMIYTKSLCMHKNVIGSASGCSLHNYLLPIPLHYVKGKVVRAKASSPFLEYFPATCCLRMPNPAPLVFVSP